MNEEATKKSPLSVTIIKATFAVVWIVGLERACQRGGHVLAKSDSVVYRDDSGSSLLADVRGEDEKVAR